MRLTLRVRRRSLADGLGTNDLRARDLVLLAGGAAAFAAALVLDRVCRAGAVGSGSIGTVMRRLRLVGVLVATGNWAVVVTFLGARCGPGVGTTLGAAVGTSVDMDLVMRMFGGGVSLSTLGAGCTLGIAGCCGMSASLSPSVSDCVMRCMSRKSWDVSMFSIPLMALAQSASACISLSCGVTVGLVMCLCWNCTVSLNLSLFVSLMWHLCVR